MTTNTEETKGLVRDLLISAMRDGFAIACEGVRAISDELDLYAWEYAEIELEKKIKALQEKE